MGSGRVTADGWGPTHQATPGDADRRTAPTISLGDHGEVDSMRTYRGSAARATQQPPARAVNRSIGPRYQIPRTQSGNWNMSEAAEPAAQRAHGTPFVIAFIVLAAGVQGVWMAFLIWLAIRTIF